VSRPKRVAVGQSGSLSYKFGISIAKECPLF
jgi:hypothetical protein